MQTDQQLHTAAAQGNIEAAQEIARRVRTLEAVRYHVANRTPEGLAFIAALGGEVGEAVRAGAQ